MAAAALFLLLTALWISLVISVLGAGLGKSDASWLHVTTRTLLRLGGNATLFARWPVRQKPHRRNRSAPRINLYDYVLPGHHLTHKHSSNTTLLSHDMEAWPDLPLIGTTGRRVPPPRTQPLCEAGRCRRPWELQSGSVRDRFWGARLARAALATTDADAWRALLAKLRAGRPITVVGVGESDNATVAAEMCLAEHQLTCMREMLSSR